ncbi:hypothetical protein CFHF_17640 [Caulobacter flavus]|uniref:Uncharacterized protein n=1 Tax=Caulobacter flavus TaxID=1679497 RepID=A0A2N5CQR1_9CAUL|nr:hypothetical protein [Caulobacter flavus]AYV48802.1 hypothetical protein C1707_22475 [Caulobacter flavus]PLR10334.1 hypothetical protein CFHF_17640 [Caulobacter flavus]
MTVEQVFEHIRAAAQASGYAVQVGDKSYQMMPWNIMVQDGGQGSADIVLENLAGTIVDGVLTPLNQGKAAFFVQEQADGARAGVGVND